LPFKNFHLFEFFQGNFLFLDPVTESLPETPQRTAAEDDPARGNEKAVPEARTAHPNLAGRKTSMTHPK